MNNRITKLFEENKKGLLSIYFTAGFPHLNDTVTIIEELEKSGADMIEIGIPFSDPLADGPTIQKSSEAALLNGMNMHLLFEQLKDIRKTVKIPLLLMGYLNPIMQFGIEKFCKKCSEVGIDGIIIPDLPMPEYLSEYHSTFIANNLSNVFLVTPQSSDERIQLIDSHSEGFIYLVSSAAITGNQYTLSQQQEEYFKRIKSMNLKKPTMIGFGISDKASFAKASEYANGAIIGSAFIKAIGNSTDLKKDIKSFVEMIRG